MTPVPILLYHSIAERSSEQFRPWTVHPRLFEEHMQLLMDAGYTAVTVSQLLDAMCRQGPGLPSKPVVLTFDDGFGDFYTQALPLMERHGFRSTLYVTTACVGRTAEWLTREGEGHRRMLSWPELRDIVDRGVDCGAHSHTHPKLDEIPRRLAREEVAASREILQDALQRPVRTFAYPHGYHSPKVRELVVDCGYDGAAAVRHAVSSTDDDRFALSRIIVYGGTTAPTMQRLLRGDGLPHGRRPPVQARHGVLAGTARSVA
jgi:peptidoglycan/xylan/chitin deacetylase (PgdA/CDA1 family)